LSQKDVAAHKQESTERQCRHKNEDRSVTRK
jgi:hypothetical protein